MAYTKNECLWVFGIRLNVPSVFAMDSPLTNLECFTRSVAL